MAHKPHWHQPSPKMDYVNDLNEMIVELTGDETNTLTKPERIVRGDIYRIIWALERAVNIIKGQPK